MKFIEKMLKRTEYVKKQNALIDSFVKEYKAGMDGFRPSVDWLDFMDVGEGVKIPLYPVHINQMFELYDGSDFLRIILHSLRREIFRNGFDVVEKFNCRCDVCGKEYDFEPDSGKCEVCGNDELTKPNPMDEIGIQKLLSEPVNSNGQILEDVLKQVEDDINVCDNAYLLLMKEFLFNGKKIVGSEIKEIIRVNPCNIAKIIDRTGRIGYTDEGKCVYVCVNHRNTIQFDNDKCDICGSEMLKAVAKTNVVEMGRQHYEDKFSLYYGEGEIIHKTRYVKSLIYGVSNLISLYAKIVSLIWMDKYIYTYYEKQRPPKGIFLVGTRNIPSFQRAWQWTKEKLKNNPHEIVPLAVETTSKNIAQFIHFDNTLAEMQFESVRNEFRHIIGASYGIMPVFSGDLQSAGVYNESLQMSVTTRAVEEAQHTHNEMLKFISEGLGFKDYKIQLVRPEKKDVMRDLDVRIKEIQIAMQMKQMGFEVKLNNRGDFVFSREATEPPMDEGMGGIPGMEGLEGMPGMEEKGSERLNDGKDGEPEHIHPVDSEIDGRPNLEGVWSQKMQGKVEEELSKIYKNKKKKRKINIKKDGILNEILEEALKELYDFSFENLDKAKSDELKDIIVDSWVNGTKSDDVYKEIIEKVPEVFKYKSVDEVGRIIFTERAVLSNVARMSASKVYEEEEDEILKFVWVSAGDNRVSPVCKEIERITNNMGGVGIDDLRKIVKYNSKKYIPALKYHRDFLPHPYCRCTFREVFDEDMKKSGFVDKFENVEFMKPVVKNVNMINKKVREAPNLSENYNLSCRGEKAVLKLLGGINANKEKNHNYPIDIMIPEKKMAIEVKSFRKSALDYKIMGISKERIKYKEKIAKDNGCELYTALVILNGSPEIYLKKGYYSGRPSGMEKIK